MVRLFRALFVLVGMFLATPALAEDFATPDEAVAFVKKAVAFYKAEGKDKAYAAFQDAGGQFQVKDLYIFVQDSKTGVLLSHGKNAGLIGKDLIGLKDADGKAFVAEMVQVAAKGAGWVDYKWVNPQTKKIQAKSSYIEPVGEVFIGAGIYK